ncbi:MAG: hypothetical protein U0793_22260 [Gemmataceae bacterium]
MNKLQTVHVRVNDTATGKPTPVRVRFTDGAGAYYAPFGRLRDFSIARALGVGGAVLIDGLPWAYIAGACEIDLPPGPIRVQACKGPEYRPLDQTMTLIAGKLSLRLTIERWVNLRDEGWVSGDMRCHFLAPHSALLEAQAEDLGVVNLLIAEGRARDESGAPQRWLANIDDFSGQTAALATAGHLVAVNSYNTSPLGALSLLHCHRVVYPLHFEALNWTLADWCGQCHRKKGLVVWAVRDWIERGFDVCEPLANLVCGDIDALEVEPAGVEALHRFWNAGLRGVPVGASGKASNAQPLGALRTYARIGPGEELNYGRWVEAVRAGHTFVSDGPLVWFAAAGQEAGGVADIPEIQDKVPIRARVAGLQAPGLLRIVRGGAIIAEARPGPAQREVSIEIEASIETSDWFQALCVSDGVAATGSFALTAPVYVRRGGRPFQPRSRERGDLEATLGAYPRLLDALQARGLFPTEQDRSRLEQVFATARARLSISD